MPSGRSRQKSEPYARIVSATTWPIVRSPGGSGAGSSGTGRSLHEGGKGRRQLFARVGKLPASTIRLGDLVRQDAHLDGRHAGERRSAQHRKALHRLDGAAARPADVRGGADRLDPGVRERPAHGGEEAWIGSEPLLDPAWVVGVAIHRFAARDHRDLGEPASTGKTHVEEAVREPQGEPGPGPCGGVHGSYAADERLSRRTCELGLGGGDDENHGGTVATAL